MSKAHAARVRARNGFYAAGLAEAGYTGIKEVFDRPYGGYLAVFGEGHTRTRHRSPRGSASSGTPSSS